MPPKYDGSLEISSKKSDLIFCIVLQHVSHGIGITISLLPLGRSTVALIRPIFVPTGIEPEMVSTAAAVAVVVAAEAHVGNVVHLMDRDWGGEEKENVFLLHFI